MKVVKMAGNLTGKWCEHCRHHYSGSHYSADGQHGVGVEYGFYGILLEKERKYEQIRAILGDPSPDIGEMSDGYHTFNELYEHRCTLFVALMCSHPEISWWSRKHHDGSMFEGGWIIAGMNLGVTPGFGIGPVGYHMKDSYTPLLSHIRELDYAPEWDGAGSRESIERLAEFAGRLPG